MLLIWIFRINIKVNTINNLHIQIIYWITRSYDKVTHRLFGQMSRKNPMQENRCNNYEGLLILSSSFWVHLGCHKLDRPNKENLDNQRKCAISSLSQIPVNLDEQLVKPQQALRSNCVSLRSLAEELCHPSSAWICLSQISVLALLAQKPFYRQNFGVLLGDAALSLRGPASLPLMAALPPLRLWCPCSALYSWPSWPITASAPHCDSESLRSDLCQSTAPSEEFNLLDSVCVSPTDPKPFS